MPSLNTMFSLKSNAMFNNAMFNSNKIVVMHIQMERLYQAAKLLKGVSGQSDLARALNASPQTINNWEERGISKQGMVKAQEVIGCSVTWIETGKGPMQVSSGTDHKFDLNVVSVPMGVREIPVISAIQAGQLTEIVDPFPPGAGFAKVYTDDEELSRWAFALEIDGDSMLPEFRPGDRVVIDPDMAPQPGDFVVAKNGHQEATFKKYRPRGVDKDGNMVFELVPLNEDYPTMRSDVEHLEIIGVMVEHIKRRRKK